MTGVVALKWRHISFAKCGFKLSVFAGTETEKKLHDKQTRSVCAIPFAVDDSHVELRRITLRAHG